MQNKPKAPKRFVFLITQLVNRYFSHDVGRDSAALTYYLLFAIFPLLIFVSTLLGVLRLDIESTSAFRDRERRFLYIIWLLSEVWMKMYWTVLPKKEITRGHL